MPFRVKLGLTVVVVLTVVAAFIHQASLGHEGPQWALVFLGPFMVVALWIFPEVARRPGDAGTPGKPPKAERP